MKASVPLMAILKRQANSLLVLSSIVFTLLFAEGACRIINFFTHFMDTYDLKQLAATYSAHPQLNHTINPNFDKMMPAQKGTDIPGYGLKANSLGFRFEEKRFEIKEPVVFRIAVLGDSQIEGFFEEEYTLPKLLEKDLTGRLKSGKRIETMNFGVSSHSTLIHYVNLKRYVLNYQPDLVILHFDLTDVYDDNVRYKELTAWDGVGNPDYVKPSLYYLNLYFNINGKSISAIDYGSQLSSLRPVYSPARIRIWLLDHSVLFKYLYAKTHSGQQLLTLYLRELEPLYPGIATMRKDDNIATLLQWCETNDSDDMRQQIAFSFGVLEKIFTLLKRNNIPLVVITVPNMAHLRENGQPPVWSRYPLEALGGFCRERGIPFHCPLTEFDAEAKKGNKIYFSDAMHNNPAGMKIWSRSLSTYLLKAGVVR